jgi:hypothetical protein
VVILLQCCNITFLNSVNAFPSWVLRVPSNLSALRSQRCYGTFALSAFVAIAKRLASGTTSILAGEPGRPRLVTPRTFVFVNGLGLGCDRYDGELDSEVAEGKTDGYDGELDSDVAETPMPDIGKTDGYDGELNSDVAEGKTDGYDGELDSDVDGYDGELDSDVAEGKSDGYDGELDSDVDGYDGELDSDVAEGKIDGYNGELDSDVAETSISSDGYDGEPDIDLADMTVRVEVDSDDACMVLAVSNMATFCLEGNFSNGELPPVKLRPLRGKRILSNTRRTPPGVKLGNDAHTLVMTSGAKVA